MFLRVTPTQRAAGDARGPVDLMTLSGRDPRMTGTHRCPACGHPLRRVAWSKLNGPSFEICRACGIEFGLDDMAPGGSRTLEALHARWRERWLQVGMPWSSELTPPSDWDPVADLEQIGVQAQQVGPERGLQHCYRLLIREHRLRQGLSVEGDAPNLDNGPA